MLILWLKFLLCSAVIFYCGVRLAKYGDVIAEKTGLGRAWIGLVLVSSVTSLPELCIGVSSVTIADTPDIALGDIMGSCVFNLAVIAILDMLHGPAPIFSKAEHGHILTAGFGIILIGLVVLSLLAGAYIPAVMHVGLYTPAIILIYTVGVKRIFLFERKKIEKFVEVVVEARRYEEISLKGAALNYALNAVVVVGAALWLPFLSGQLAEATGLGQSFVGTALVAMTTSLPELVVSITTLKIGATDMAVASLFGSNIFNILILALEDILYVKGPLLSHVSTNHAVTGVTAVLITGITVVGLTYRLEKKTFPRLGSDAAAIILAYGVNLYLLYIMR